MRLFSQKPKKLTNIVYTEKSLVYNVYSFLNYKGDYKMSRRVTAKRRESAKKPGVTMVKIDKNIAEPTPIDRKYPITLLEPGDSFFTPKADVARVRTSIYRYRAKNRDLKFTSRTEVNDGIEGMRFWRTK